MRNWFQNKLPVSRESHRPQSIIFTWFPVSPIHTRHKRIMICEQWLGDCYWCFIWKNLWKSKLYLHVIFCRDYRWLFIYTFVKYFLDIPMCRQHFRRQNNRYIRLTLRTKNHVTIMEGILLTCTWTKTALANRRGPHALQHGPRGQPPLRHLLPVPAGTEIVALLQIRWSTTLITMIKIVARHPYNILISTTCTVTS